MDNTKWICALLLKFVELHSNILVLSTILAASEPKKKNVRKRKWLMSLKQRFMRCKLVIKKTVKHIDNFPIYSKRN